MIELLAIVAACRRRLVAVHARQDGFAFAASTRHHSACIVAIFVDLYPNVMVSSTNPAYNLTVHNTASAPYSLKAMTIVVIIFLPLVLAYQAWAYYVFRRRVSASEFQPAAPAAAEVPAGQARPPGRTCRDPGPPSPRGAKGSGE